MTSGERSGWPVVIEGCHRSGTSLVRRIRDSHSRIHCGPEVPFFRDFYGDYSDDSYAHLRFSTARSLLSEDPKVAATDRVHGDGAWRLAPGVRGGRGGRIWSETREVWTRVDPRLEWVDLP